MATLPASKPASKPVAMLNRPHPGYRWNKENINESGMFTICRIQESSEEDASSSDMGVQFSRGETGSFLSIALH